MVDSNSRFMRFAVVLALCASLLALGLIFLQPQAAPPANNFAVQGTTRFPSLVVDGDFAVNDVSDIDLDQRVISIGDVSSTYSDTQVVVDDEHQAIKLGNIASGDYVGISVSGHAIDADAYALYASKPVEVETGSTRNVAATEAGVIFANTAATGTVTLSLPAATAGLNYCFYVAAAQVLAVDPATGDQILGLTNATGDKITNSTIGSFVCLAALDTTNWGALASGGTWADAN